MFIFLFFKESEELDAGLYECIASNVVGEQSITYNVDVLVSARIDGGSPPEVHVVEHSVAVLECLVYGIPFPDIRFL